MNKYPHVEDMGDEVIIQKGIDGAETTATVTRYMPFGPDIDLVVFHNGPIQMSGDTSGRVRVGLLMELDKAQEIWDVLTYAITQHEPAWVAARMRELEGAEVMRQELPFSPREANPRGM